MGDFCRPVHLRIDVDGGYTAPRGRYIPRSSDLQIDWKGVLTGISNGYEVVKLEVQSSGSMSSALNAMSGLSADMDLTEMAGWSRSKLTIASRFRRSRIDSCLMLLESLWMTFDGSLLLGWNDGAFFGCKIQDHFVVTANNDRAVLSLSVPI